MGRNKQRRRKADSELTPGHGVPKAEVQPHQTTPTVASHAQAGNAAASAIQDFYDKLVELPLDENSPKFFTRKLITRATIETVGLPNLIRQKKNEAILLSVIDAVQQKPDMLTDFCEVLDSMDIAKALAQQIKGRFQELEQLEQMSAPVRLSTLKGPDCCQRMFQGWCLVLILLVLLLGILIVSYIAAQRVTGKPTEWQVRFPPIPTAFTGRENETQRIVDFVVKEDVGIVSITGGPGHGKSSVAIASSHQLMEHGIPVCYVSLSEADSIETFIMTLLHVLTKNTERHPDKLQIFSWVRLLKERTVIVLDNADHLTLRQTELRQDFIKLLKNVVAESIYLHLIVVTRYRFKIANDFEEIHLQPLASPQALSLLRYLICASRHVGDAELTEEQLQMITNETGGIPLAIKVVGRLVKSGVLSVVEVLEELSNDPVSTLSEDSFTPDEQLKRCIDLSYKHLSPLGQKCFLFAASFPGSFDRKAKKNIIANLIGDGHCLNQLVDRSLVEYSAVTNRYNMHALLRAFARDSGVRSISLEKYYKWYAKHYFTVLTKQVKRAKSCGNVSSLYTTLVVDYHNFVQLLSILSTQLKISIVHKDEMELALEAFQIMQSRFPREALLGWWTRLLSDVCQTTAPDFQVLAPQFLDLSTKLAQLLSYHQKYSLAMRILLFSYNCILEDKALASSFLMCEHPQLNSYTTMLQVLARVCEKEGALDTANGLNQTIQRCLRLTPNKNADEIIPHNFCSDGIDYVKETYENFKDLTSTLQFFDALLKCKVSEAVSSIKLLEDAFKMYLAESPTPSVDSLQLAALRVAKRMYMVSNYEREARWLVRSVECTGFKTANILTFYAYFRLTKLYWYVMNSKQEALETGRATYAMAMNLSLSYPRVWKAAVRLADILNQIDGHHEEATLYFQEALDHLPFIDADPDFIHDYKHFIELNLVSLYLQSRQFSKFFQHYGQWAKLEAVETARDARKILDLYYNVLSVRRAKSSSLAIVDTSLEWQLKGLDTAWRFLNTYICRVRDSTMQYAKFTFYLLQVLHVSVYLLGLACCFAGICNKFACVAPVLVILARALYILFVLGFSFLYFIYVAIVKQELRKPKLSPSLPIILKVGFINCFVVLIKVCIVLTYVVNFIALYLVSRQSYSLRSESYYNVSMDIVDTNLYSFIN